MTTLKQLREWVGSSFDRDHEKATALAKKLAGEKGHKVSVRHNDTKDHILYVSSNHGGGKDRAMGHLLTSQIKSLGYEHQPDVPESPDWTEHMFIHKASKASRSGKRRVI